ncbi:hypothetical protein Tco_0164342 [Tanacetum coccineum]
MVSIALVKRKASTSLVGTSEASQPNRKRRLKKKSSESGSSTPTVEQAEDVEDVDLSETDYCGFLKDNLKRDEGNSSRSASIPNLRFGKRLGSPPPRFSHDVLSDPSHAGTSNAPSSNHADVRRGIVPTSAAGKARAKVIRWQLDPMDMLARSALARDHEYNDIPDDDFSTATLGEEIDLTLFPLALGPYCMSYLFVDEANILTKEIFKDPDVCKRDLDRTITPEKVKRKVVQLTELSYEFSNMEEKYEKVQKGCHALDHENEDLRSFRDASSDEVKRLMDHLAKVEATAARYQLYPLQH